MATRPRPPNTAIALVAEIVDDPRRTRHAAILVLILAFALALILVPVLVVMTLFGTTGAIAVGGVSALTTAGITAQRAANARRSRITPQQSQTPIKPLAERRSDTPSSECVCLGSDENPNPP